MKQPRKERPAKEKAPGKKKPEGKKAAGKEAEKKALVDTSLEGSLAVEAHHLRVVLREITSHLVADLESDIVRVIDMVGQVPEGRKRKAQLQEILKEMQALDIKPNKGRLGDLRRIRDLVRKVRGDLEEIL